MLSQFWKPDVQSQGANRAAPSAGSRKGSVPCLSLSVRWLLGSLMLLGLWQHHSYLSLHLVTELLPSVSVPKFPSSYKDASDETSD